MKKVLVLGNVRIEGIEILKEFSQVIQLAEPASKKDMIRHIVDSDAVLHKIAPLGRDVLQHQAKLRIVARHGVGIDELDLDYLKEMKIPVSITLDANANAVAEAVLALIFNLLRHVNQAENMIKKDKQWRRETLMGRELKYLTVGIVGYGRIGALVAGYLTALGCKVVVYDINHDAVSGSGYQSLTFEELAATADIVSLHCPLTTETRGFVNADVIGLMKNDAMIVNTARGALIEKAALIRALQTGRLGGAALDVFDEEPPDFEDELFKTDNVLATPHIAAMTINAQVAMARNAALEIKRVLVDGMPPSNNVLT